MFLFFHWQVDYLIQIFVFDFTAFTITTFSFLSPLLFSPSSQLSCGENFDPFSRVQPISFSSSIKIIRNKSLHLLYNLPQWLPFLSNHLPWTGRPKFIKSHFILILTVLLQPSVISRHFGYSLDWLFNNYDVTMRIWHISHQSRGSES